MTKAKIKSIIFSVVFATIISLVIWGITVLLVNNLDTMGKLIYNNQYFISYMKRLSQKNKEYPLAILFCLTIINSLCFIFLKKQKIIFIVLIIIVSIVGLISFILITKLGDLFIFQHLEELKDLIMRYSQFS